MWDGRPHTEAVLMASVSLGRRGSVAVHCIRISPGAGHLYTQFGTSHSRSRIHGTGPMDAARSKHNRQQTAAVVVQSPNFWASSNRWRTGGHGHAKGRWS